MRTLLFRNPIFSPGVNTTVRRGIKWADESKDDEFNSIEICQNNGAFISYGEIIRREVYKFCDIPTKVLQLEHDPKCRTQQGIHNEMMRMYPYFHPDEIVTVIYFEIHREKS